MTGSTRTTFDSPAGHRGRPHGTGEGIDTIADVTLNSQPLMHCENMLIPHSADVTGRLKAAGNVLQAKIRSTILHARQFDYKPSEMAREHRIESSFIRKARHMWGWDNAPRLVSAGLWRPVAVRGAAADPLQAGLRLHGEGPERRGAHRRGLGDRDAGRPPERLPRQDGCSPSRTRWRSSRISRSSLRRASCGGAFRWRRRSSGGRRCLGMPARSTSYRRTTDRRSVGSRRIKRPPRRGL